MEKITAQTGPLAFIGGGAMTEAIIKGILGAGLADPGEIFVGEPSAARCEYLQKTYGIKASGDNKAVVKDAGLIILAVKPQDVYKRQGMDEKGRKVAANSIKDALKEKYPPAKKGGVNTVASAKAVAKAMQNHPFENADAPVLAELVAVGKELGVDRVIYMEMEPPRNKETGFMVIVGSQTYRDVYKRQAWK